MTGAVFSVAAAPRTGAGDRRSARDGAGGRLPRRLWPRHWGWPAVLALIGLALGTGALVVWLTGMEAGYDAWGWLVWGQQVLHGHLNTDGAPSWKPLTFLFTLPYALAGSAQPTLWMITAVGGALGGSLLAARIAARLTEPAPGRRWCAWVAGLSAGVALLGIDTYAHLVLIANVDPLIVTLCLAAIEAHLAGRPRLALVLGILAALGRPEVWPLIGLYGLWRAWRIPRMRWLLPILVVIPALWFVIPAITSHSWFISGNLDLNQATAIQGSKPLGVLRRFLSLYPLPIELLALWGVGLAVLRRDRVTLTLAAACLVWLAVEVGFALHGFSAVPRFLIEPAAVEMVIAGATIGRLLGGLDRRDPHPTWLIAASRVVGPLLVVAVVITVWPTASARERVTRYELAQARLHGRQVRRLHDVIARIGGPARIRRCGQPTSLVGFQSTLAWAVGLNVGNVGYRPGKAIDAGKAIVLFKPHERGWVVSPWANGHPAPPPCQSLRAQTPFG
jgi:hypothetical protein